MLDLGLMTTTLVNTFRDIPALVPYLANQDPNMISGYIDEAPGPNSLQGAVYSMPGGSVLVSWIESDFNDSEEMSAFIHRFNLYLRSAPGQSGIDMVMALVNGIPTGENRCWRLLCLLPELYSTNLLRVAREIDAQQIDYFVTEIEMKETGDA